MWVCLQKMFKETRRKILIRRHRIILLKEPYVIFDQFNKKKKLSEEEFKELIELLGLT